MSPVAELIEAIERYLEADRTAQKQRTTASLERKVRTQLRRTWRRQKRAVLAALAKRRSVFPKVRARAIAEAATPEDLARTIPDQVKTDSALVASIDVTARRAFDLGATHTALELGIDTAFDITIPEAGDYMRRWGAQRVTAIDEFTRARLRKLLTDAVEGNWTYSETAKAITTLFDGFSARSPLAHIRNRAELVSVTEIGDAYEYAGQLSAQGLIEQGIALEKRWLVAGDERVCPTCTDAGAQDWIPHTDTFANGLDGPLGHPGCRCAMGRRVVEKKPRRS